MNSNYGIQFGHSSRLGYDAQFVADEISDSVAPIMYRMNPIASTNCNSCLSVFGPRPASNSATTGTGGGVSTVLSDQSVAPSQDLVDVESILSNRNVIASKAKDGQVNDIDITRFQLQHARICNDFLDPVATHLTNPPANYRGMSINRFHDLPKPAQANIFYDFAVNTKLEAKDNYRERVPRLMRYDPALPREFTGRNKPCKYNCYGRCPHQ